jgi:hypothetical protein
MSKVILTVCLFCLLSLSAKAQSVGNSTPPSNSPGGGIDDSSIEKSVRIYPNPSTSGFFTVEFDNADKIKVVNVLGVTVMEEKLSSSESKKSVDLSRYSNGVYFISLLNGSKRAEYRVVINRIAD